MTLTSAAGSTDVLSIPALDHQRAMDLAVTEFARTLDLWCALEPDDWQRPTVCPLWDVRAVASHVLGMAEAQASFGQFIHDFRAAAKRESGAMIDAMTATQVRERAALTPPHIIDRLAAVAPAAVRARRHTPALLRRAIRMPQDPPFERERWSYGYLVDTIFTRDAWMHRLDVSRATSRLPVVSPEHDGRIVADVVREWASRHGQPFTLVLHGDAGGRWTQGHGGDQFELEALDFAWALAGRAPGVGLLAVPVPF
jgi:uncharacterized protein (TIGR03083 family)